MMNLNLLVEYFKKYSDGHFTVMEFTTNFRASFSTPNYREDIDEMPVAKEKGVAILLAIKELCTQNQLNLFDELIKLHEMECSKHE